jgi:hypothetical protein
MCIPRVNPQAVLRVRAAEPFATPAS